VQEQPLFQKKGLEASSYHCPEYFKRSTEGTVGGGSIERTVVKERRKMKRLEIMLIKRNSSLEKKRSFNL
jgi:hypothetical protein